MLEHRSRSRYAWRLISEHLSSPILLKLVRGNAEIFGFELAEGKVYLFGYECKAAVYTWRGCTIEISFLAIATIARCG